MRHLGKLTLGLALASAAATAQAQTVISRQVTTEPVETVVTQGPNGTIVTRRPISAAPIASTPAITTYPSTDGSTVVETIETVQQPATVTREVVRPRVVTRDIGRTKSRPARVSRQSTVTTTERVVTRQAAPLSLTPDQRRVVYRTIVRERPASVVTREIVSPPAPRVIPTYPPVTLIATDGSAPVVEAIDDGYVGTMLPRDVVFYNVPNNVTMSVPAARPYRYAYVDGRILLVDPVTRMVVEDVTE